jgi:hypothetical protein
MVSIERNLFINKMFQIYKYLLKRVTHRSLVNPFQELSIIFHSSSVILVYIMKLHFVNSRKFSHLSLEFLADFGIPRVIIQNIILDPERSRSPSELYNFYKS